MAVPKRQPVKRQPHVVTAEQRQLADRVDRARRANPPRDPTGQHHEACRQIADAAGVDVFDVLDLWSERAAIRTWDGGMSQADAEAAAVGDVRNIFVKQSKLDIG